MNFLLQEKTLKEGEKKAVSDDENYFPFNNKTIKTFSSSTYILDLNPAEICISNVLVFQVTTSSRQHQCSSGVLW